MRFLFVPWSWEPSLPFVLGAKGRGFRYMQHILQLARLGRRIEWVPISGKVVIPLFSFGRRRPSDGRPENDISIPSVP